MSGTFGDLHDIPLRDAWAHEALDFTPWLAENLDRLGEALGIRMELVAQEQRVTKYSADIVARDTLDDSLVLIENQLEWTDHGHLGQIITYLGGVDARTVVWIARDFEAAHLAAVDWLNRNTLGDYRFFAVRLRTVRIADSPIAPIFEVVGRPNEWQRDVRNAVSAPGSRAEIVARRR